MRPPSRALVLAAGFGTRMRPFTDDRPKPLLPFWGRPVLAHTLAMLRDWGVRDVLVNAHHRAGDLMDWLRLHPTPGLRVSISFEPEILGTGGPLARAAWWVDASPEPFWICNGDIAARVDPAPLLRDFHRHRPLASLWMLPDRGPRTVRVERGLVTDFAVKPAGADGTFTFSGLHLVSPRIRAFSGPEVFSSIIDAYRAAQQAGESVRGVAVPGSWWADLGTPEQLLKAHEESAAWMGSSNRHGDGFVALAPDTVVHPRARLRNVVVDEGVVLRAGARLTDAVVGRGTVVDGPATRAVVPARVALTATEWTALRAAVPKAGEHTAAECLDLRGSDRIFLRLRSGRWTGIAVRHGTQRKENENFTPLARFLARAGVPAPRILLDLPDQRFFVMEDLGTRDLLAAVKDASPARLRRLYHPVLELAARLHTRAHKLARRVKPPLQTSFDPALWTWEHNLFREQFLERVHKLTPEQCAPILRDLAGVAARLHAAPPSLVHRDFQSTNVILRREGPAIIDFQGMRFGPAAYDVASLLADPYVMLPAAVQDALVNDYAELTGDAGILDLFPCAAIQRLAQALGAYGRLGSAAATRRFLQYIPPALAMMERLAARVEGVDALRAFLRGVAGKPN